MAYFRNRLTSGWSAYFRLNVQLSQSCAQALHIFAYNTKKTMNHSLVRRLWCRWFILNKLLSQKKTSRVLSLSSGCLNSHCRRWCVPSLVRRLWCRWFILSINYFCKNKPITKQAEQVTPVPLYPLLYLHPLTAIGLQCGLPPCWRFHQLGFQSELAGELDRQGATLAPRATSRATLRAQGHFDGGVASASTFTYLLVASRGRVSPDHLITLVSK